MLGVGSRTVLGRAKVVMVGTFPPPVMGQSLVNARIGALLRARGVELLEIDTSPPSVAAASWLRAVYRLPKILRGARRLAATAKSQPVSVYIGLAGGYAQIFDALYATVARLLKARLFVHHDCYDYVNRARWRTRLVLRVAGEDATHLVLCEDMDARLRRCYGRVRRTVLLSNAGLFGDQGLPTAPRPRLTTIAFFGNLTREKGLEEFMAVARRLSRRLNGLQWLVAGPFHDKKARMLVSEGEDQVAGFTYVGPRYDEDRVAFYKHIDVLLFPSKYRNEAEPLVVHEAMCAGVAVIAWDRGCIRSMRPAVLVPSDADFVDAAVELLALWAERPDLLRAATQVALERVAALRAERHAQVEDVLDAMMASPRSAPG